MKPSARVRTIFDAVQWVLLAAVGLLGAAELVKTSRHMHDVLRALNGDDWNDGGWYFVSMAGSGVAVGAVDDQRRAKELEPKGMTVVEANVEAFRKVAQEKIWPQYKTQYAGLWDEIASFKA